MRRSLAFLLFSTACLSSSMLLADTAEQMLGVHRMHLPVREVIDESFGDSPYIVKLIKAAQDGEAGPDDVANAIVKDAEERALDAVEKALGSDAAKLAAAASHDSFVKAEFHTKTASHMHVETDVKAKVDAAEEEVKEKTGKVEKNIEHILVPKVDVKASPIHADTNVPPPEEMQERVKKAQVGDIDPSANIREKVNEIQNRIRTPEVNVKAPDLSASVNAGAISDKVKAAANIPDIDAKVNAGSVSAKVDPGAISSKVNVASNLPDIAGKVQNRVDPGDIRARVDKAISLSDIDAAVNPDDITAKVDAGVDPNTIVNKVDAGVDTGDITKKVDADVNANDIAAKVDAAVKVDDIQKKVAASVNAQDIRSKITTSVSVDLDIVRDKVKDATSQAFTQLHGFMQTQIDSKQNDFNAARDHYNSITIPPVQTERICTIHSPGVCWKHETVETAESHRARADAQAKKDVAKSQMDAAEQEVEKYQAAQQNVDGQGQGVLANLDKVFGGAQTDLADTDGSSAGDDDSNDPNPPKQQHGTTPLGAHNDNVVEIDGSLVDDVFADGEIAAAIGANSVATINVGDVGDFENTTVGSERETITAPGVISAAIGYETLSRVVVGDTDGIVTGTVTRSITAPGLLVAAIGANSDGRVTVGNLAGDVYGSADQNIVVAGALAAAIGGDTSASVDIGNTGENVRTGTLTQRIRQLSPALSAAIGYDSTARVSIGQILANVGGSANQNITSGPIVSASIGGETSSIVRIGEINQRIGGNLDQNIVTGDVLSVSIGGNTHAKTDVGVIDAPVSGNVDMTINTGSIVTGTVGIGTNAESLIGNVYAPVSGNLTTNINTGSINSFAIGIGIGSDADIHAHTHIGNVFAPVNGSQNISVSTGGIISLGFGLILDLGPFGTLNLSKSTCNGGVSLGNVGDPC